VSRGVYRLTDPAEGATRSIEGPYLNVLRRDDGGWRILRQQMNYDIDMTPDVWLGERSALEDMSATGTLLKQLGFSARDVGGLSGTAPPAGPS
jgi:hypothetical protein